MYSYWGQANINLTKEMEELNYSNIRNPAQLRGGDITKTDAPILSSTTGFFNTAFGAAAYQQLNVASTLFNMLPKFAHKRSGYRAQTTRFINSSVGVAENAAVPESVKPTKVQVSVPTKEQSIAFEFSQREKLLAGTEDDVSFDYAQLLQSAKNDFAYAIDADMNEDVTDLPTYNMESIDRVVSSYAEVTNCADLTAGDADIYGLDRDAAATWADAYVNHNSGTKRVLSESIVNDLVKGTVAGGADARSQAWYCGTDTYEQLMSLYSNALRYEPSTGTAPTGGKAEGTMFGSEMGTLRGRPVFVTPYDKVATNGDISNLYLLDVGYDGVYNEPILGVKVLQAPIIAETKLENYPAHAKLGNEVLLYSAMELECKNFKRQGKARDLDEVA